MATDYDFEGAMKLVWGWYQWQVDLYLKRIDRDGWPTRDAAATEEDC